VARRCIVVSWIATSKNWETKCSAREKGEVFSCLALSIPIGVSRTMEVAHGFQYVQSFEKHQTETVKQVVFNKHTKKYVSLDVKCMRLWDLHREHKIVRFKKDNFIQALVYIETRQVYLAAAMDMSIKVYDQNLEKVCVSSTSNDISIEERALTSLVYDFNTETLVTGSVTGCHIWNFRGSRYKRASQSAQYALDWLEQFPGSEGKWIHRVDFGPITPDPVEVNRESRRVHCAYENSLLVYNLIKNKKNKYLYHTLKKKVQPGDKVECRIRGGSRGYEPGIVVEVTLPSSLRGGEEMYTICLEETGEVRKGFTAKDMKGGKDETIHDLCVRYKCTESQFRTWNDMITGEPLRGHTYVVEYVPHIVRLQRNLRQMHEHSITGVVRDEEMGYLVTSALDLEIKIWNTKHDYSVVKVLSGHAKPVTGLAPHPIPGLLISSGMDCTLRVWSLVTLKEEYVMETQSPVHRCGYESVQNAQQNKPVGKFITVIGATVVLWKHHTLTKLFAVARSSPVNIQLAGDSVVVVCHDHSARVLKASTGSVRNTLLPDDAATLMTRVLYSDEHHRYYGLLRGGQVFVYSSKRTTASLCGRWGKEVLAHGDCVNCVCLVSSRRPKTHRLYVGPVNNMGESSSQSLHRVPFQPAFELLENEPLVADRESTSREHGWWGPERDLQEYLVAGTAKGYLVVWDAWEGDQGEHQIHTYFNVHKDSVTDIEADPGRPGVLVCFIKQELVLIVDLPSEAVLQTIALTETESVPSHLTCVQVSPTRSLMLLGTASGLFDIVNLIDGTRPQPSESFQHKDAVLTASFLDRFYMVATGSMDCTIKLWETSTMLLLTEIPFVGPVRALVFVGNRGALLVGDRHDVCQIDPRAYHLPAILLDLSKNKQHLDFSMSEFATELQEEAALDSPKAAVSSPIATMGEVDIWKKILPQNVYDQNSAVIEGTATSPATVIDERPSSPTTWIGIDAMCHQDGDLVLVTPAPQSPTTDVVSTLRKPALPNRSLLRKQKKKKIGAGLPSRPILRNWKLPPPDYPRPYAPPASQKRPSLNARPIQLGGRRTLSQQPNIEGMSCAVGRTPTPSDIGGTMSERLSALVQSREHDTSDRTQRAHIVHIHMDSGSKRAQLEAHLRRQARRREEEKRSRTFSKPLVYQLPPKPAAFAPSSEPWTTLGSMAAARKY
jgi:WD40 repeat protein